MIPAARLPRPRVALGRTSRFLYRRALSDLLVRLGLDAAPAAVEGVLVEYGMACLERDRLIADLEDARARNDRPAIRDAGRSLHSARGAVERLEEKVEAARAARPANPLDALAKLNARIASRAQQSVASTPGYPEKQSAQSAAGEDAHISQVTEDIADAEA